MSFGFKQCTHLLYSKGKVQQVANYKRNIFPRSSPVELTNSFTPVNSLSGSCRHPMRIVIPPPCVYSTNITNVHTTILYIKVKISLKKYTYIYIDSKIRAIQKHHSASQHILLLGGVTKIRPIFDPSSASSLAQKTEKGRHIARSVSNTHW